MREGAHDDRQRWCLSRTTMLSGPIYDYHEALYPKVRIASELARNHQEDSYH